MLVKLRVFQHLKPDFEILEELLLLQHHLIRVSVCFPIRPAIVRIWFSCQLLSYQSVLPINIIPVTTNILINIVIHYSIY